MSHKNTFLTAAYNSCEYPKEFVHQNTSLVHTHTQFSQPLNFLCPSVLNLCYHLMCNIVLPSGVINNDDDDKRKLNTSCLTLSYPPSLLAHLIFLHRHTMLDNSSITFTILCNQTSQSTSLITNSNNSLSSACFLPVFSYVKSQNK